MDQELDRTILTEINLFILGSDTFTSDSSNSTLTLYSYNKTTVIGRAYLSSTSLTLTNSARTSINLAAGKNNASVYLELPSSSPGSGYLWRDTNGYVRIG